MLLPYRHITPQFPISLRWIPRNPNDRILLLSQMREQLDKARRHASSDDMVPAEYLFHLLTEKAMIDTALAEFPAEAVDILYRDVCRQIEAIARK